MKNQYIGGEMPKKGVLEGLQIRGALAKKMELMFLRWG